MKLPGRPARSILVGLLSAVAGLAAKPEAGFAEPKVVDSKSATPQPSEAGEADDKLSSLQAMSRSIQRARLKNGLRVVLQVDKSSPTAAVCVTYDVGSRNEVPGRSGFAHLFEHMMFQGSRNVAKGDHFTWITSRGGSLNGTTSTDRTNYFEVLPSNGLKLGLWLEADRMKTLAVTQENFENQRKVVQEEYRMRISNAAYAQGWISINDLAYGSYWPYAHSTIGSMADLDNARLEWLQEFHQAYYSPNNAVLSVAGDFEPAEVLSWIQEYFGGAAEAETPDYEPPPVEPQEAPRSIEIVDQNAPTPGLFWAYVIPPFREPDHYALEVATLLLGYGETSRLYHLMVRDKSVARAIDVWTNDRRGPDLFVLRAVLSESGTIDEASALMDQQIERLKTELPSKDELEKAKNQLVSSFIFGLESNMSRARRLGEYELYWGDARLLTSELDNYLAVTAEDIQRTVKKYLKPEARSTVIVRPASEATAPIPSSEAPSSQQSKEAR